jgi:hypothetical protein
MTAPSLRPLVGSLYRRLSWPGQELFRTPGQTYPLGCLPERIRHGSRVPTQSPRQLLLGRVQYPPRGCEVTHLPNCEPCVVPGGVFGSTPPSSSARRHVRWRHGVMGRSKLPIEVLIASLVIGRPGILVHPPPPSQRVDRNGENPGVAEIPPGAP